MKSGYQDYFKKAQRVADRKEPARRAPHPSQEVFRGASADQLRALLRARKSAPKLSRGLPWKAIFGMTVICVAAGFAYVNLEQVENFLDHVDISFFGTARAEEAPKAEAGKPAGKSEEKRGEGETAGAAEHTAAEGHAPATAEEISHLTRLRERQHELDVREEELSRTEAELDKQKQELEERLKQLQTTRSEISTVLQDRAQADDKKVDDLVQVYSTMKPQQAAKIFETMDEALAVEILGRMKKKPAAEILNLIKAEKAQMISEKYAGYKRRN